MMFGFLANRMPSVRIDGPNVYIRPPRRGDERQWMALRRISRDFLIPWEPSWPSDATTAAAYRRRYRRFCEDWRLRVGFAFFVFDQKTNQLLGGITLSNVRRLPPTQRREPALAAEAGLQGRRRRAPLSLH
jgi:ribosomal-protein-alanine N-acetyltransferase